MRDETKNINKFLSLKNINEILILSGKHFVNIREMILLKLLLFPYFHKRTRHWVPSINTQCLITSVLSAYPFKCSMQCEAEKFNNITFWWVLLGYYIRIRLFCKCSFLLFFNQYYYFIIYVFNSRCRKFYQKAKAN